MSDLHALLDREADRMDAAGDELELILNRVHRRDRNRKVASVVIALVLAGLGIRAAQIAFTSSQRRPAAPTGGGSIPSHLTLSWTVSKPAHLADLVVDRGVAYVPSVDGSFYAFGATTGNTLWRGVNPSPGPWYRALIEGDVVYSFSLDGAIRAFPRGCHPVKGVCQPVRTSQLGQSVISNPILAGGQLILSTTNGEVRAYSTDCLHSDRPCVVRWRAGTDQPTSSYINGPKAIGSIIYLSGWVDQSTDGLAHPKLYAFPLACGTDGAVCRPLWTASASGNSLSLPTQAAGVVYVGADDGHLYAFPADCAADGGACAPSWIGTTGHNSTLSDPVVGDGVVYVSSWDGSLFAFSTTCGTGGRYCSPLWTGRTGAGLLTAPVIAGKWVYVAGDDGRVYGFATACRPVSGECPTAWSGSIGRASVPEAAAAVGDRLYVSSYDGLVSSFQLPGASSGLSAAIYAAVVYLALGAWLTVVVVRGVRRRRMRAAFAS